ncbi:GntR family transcriptional regulator [Luteipulveratus sp. YIM 133132]|uniref:GntR family transcriptional regulator n=1 Tax=Luteipulveratus flavus TaxID=3031728 RepID=UPI0023AF5CAF|nr:GntR family transcriptional regulator [Luteipulveratus sp. YIM 133132]MDE9366906.1 GntR family transcriptional regulator [Luteipulveratus sp. YIM 133132]
MSTSTAAPASERVYEHVKHAILRGDRAGGTFFTEGQIGDEVGVSRTPVREALLRLETEGLVALYPKKGALVVPVTPREAHEVLEARLVIEEWAAGRAWAARADLVVDLRGHLAAMVDAKAADDVAGFSEADRAFHEAIVAAAGNSVMARQYRMLRDRQMCILADGIRASASRMTHAVTAHRTLIRLLTEGTRAEFVRESRAHVQDAMDRLGVAR